MVTPVPLSYVLSARKDDIGVKIMVVEPVITGLKQKVTT
jgi:hypothetical protein